MSYCFRLDFDQKPDYSMLLGLVEGAAKANRLDINNGCFDWNLIKASKYLYSDLI